MGDLLEFGEETVFEAAVWGWSRPVDLAVEVVEAPLGLRVPCEPVVSFLDLRRSSCRPSSRALMFPSRRSRSGPDARSNSSWAVVSSAAEALALRCQWRRLRQSMLGMRAKVSAWRRPCCARASAWAASPSGVSA